MTLEAHARRLAYVPVRELFATDPERFARFSQEACGLLLDFSRQRIDSEALAALVDHAQQAGLSARIDAMLDGAIVNETEQRAALHTLLRVPAGSTLRSEERRVGKEWRALASTYE